MSHIVIGKLSGVEEIIHSMPLSLKGHKEIMNDRREIQNILEGKDKRLIIIIGPCSAWPNEAVLEYAKRLSSLNKRVRHALKLIMRVYIQKPRTTIGWMGPYSQPDPFLGPDIESGVRYVREMMINVITMGLPIATEALFTHHSNCFLELATWVAIGARSSEDPEHRVFASSLNCPVGLKNPTHGSLETSVNSIVAAQQSHIAAFDKCQVKTFGNPFAHLVLRGSNLKPNYSIEHLRLASKLMHKNKIKNPSLMIDVSHDNCIVDGKRKYHRQPKIVMEVINNLKNNPDLKNLVKGFMLESFLKGGNQPIDSPNLDREGLSITDPCLGWEDTEDFLLNLAELLPKGND